MTNDDDRADKRFRDAIQLERDGKYTEAFSEYVNTAQLYLELRRRCPSPAIASTESTKPIDTITTKYRLVLERAERTKELCKSANPVNQPHSAVINGRVYPQWRGSNGANHNPAPLPLPALSTAQLRRGATYQRIAHTDAAIYTIYTPDTPTHTTHITQHDISDCSVVASLSACHSHNGRFGGCLGVSALHPHNEHGLPRVSDEGVYEIRFYLNGAWRCVAVDDRLPQTPQGDLVAVEVVADAAAQGIAHPVAAVRTQIWPALLEKAIMSLWGTYEFSGSDSSTDLQMITGWIPEQIKFNSSLFKQEKTWRRVLDGSNSGICLLTLGSKSRSADMAQSLLDQGFVENHAYAVSRVAEEGDRRVVIVDGQWQTRDRDYDYAHTHNHIRNQTQSLSLDWEYLTEHFDTLYLSWDPDIFAHSATTSFTIATETETETEAGKRSNPLEKYPRFTVQGGVGEVWVLLTRHIGRSESSQLGDNGDRSDKTVYSALHTSRHSTSAQNMYTTDRPSDIVQDASHTNSINTLSKQIVKRGMDIGVVVSQLTDDDCNYKYNYTLTAYASSPLRIANVSDLRAYGYSRRVSGAWTVRTAGGHSSTLSFGVNPMYVMRIGKCAGGDGCTLRLVLESDRDIAVNVKIVWGTERVFELRGIHIAGDSGVYTHKLAVMERDQVVSGREYTVVVSAFEAGQLASFTLFADCSAPISLSPLAQEGSGLFAAPDTCGVVDRPCSDYKLDLPRKSRVRLRIEASSQVEMEVEGVSRCGRIFDSLLDSGIHVVTITGVGGKEQPYKVKMWTEMDRVYKPSSSKHSHHHQINRGMDIAHPISSKPKSVSFGFLTTDEIKKISVKQIVNPNLLDNTGRPTAGGLYDPALGPSDRGDICATCGLSSFNCPGHFGHIELPTVNYHPLFFNHCFNILRGVCLYCHKFKLDPAVVARYVAKLALLDYGLLDEAEQVDLIKRGVTDADDEESATKLSKKALKALEKDRELDAYKDRVNSWVRFNIHKAHQSGKTRDEYKSGLVYQTRKRLFHQLFKQMYRKKCDNCSAYAHAFRKEGTIKIIEYSLTPKQEAHHSALNLSRPDVLKEQAAVDKNARDALNEQSTAHTQNASSSDGSDDDSSESEGEGDDTHSNPPHSNQDQNNNLDADADEEDDIAALKANNKANAAALKRSERVMPASEVQSHLHRLFQNEKPLVSIIFSRHGPFPTSEAMADIFFMSAIPVPPTRFRPAARMGDALMEHPQNELLGAVLQTSLRIRDYNNEMSALNDKEYAQTMANNSSLGADGVKIIRDRTYQRLLEELITLQHGVNSFIDSSKNPARLPQGREPTPGVKQVLEKKEGLFRKHMMGKRVNHAARSVISPDVNIETSEIGVPPVFAKTLTYPEPVTAFNVSYLRKLVINGPKNYPGASMIQYEDGRMESLEKKSQEQRTAIANQLLTPSNRPDNQNKMTTRTTSINKKVFRHLRDGDLLLLNRQPTLHKPSMMAHKAKVLHGERTIRMHYANCKSYNADFDGDEMNMHFAQSAIAKAEMKFIANNDSQYLVPTSGKPLRGLIQDHVVAGSWMTMKSTFFSRDEYQQLLYGALRPENDYTGGGRVHLLPPAIWKPKPLWTGKQIISTILQNITPANARGLNLESESKVKAEYLPAWGSNENKVVILDGVVCSGIIDSSQFGTSSYGLVHSVFELYGSDIAGKLLSILSRLFTKYLQHRGFTCRMDDLILTDDGNKDRDNILQSTKGYGFEAAIDSIGLTKEQSEGSEGKRNVLMRLEEVLRDDDKLAMMDQASTSKNEQIKSQILKKTLPNGLWRHFPSNHFQAMVLTGSKGSAVNASQISCLLGQQSLEGRRVPVMVSGKTLPCFKPFETDMRAGGFVAQRFLTGIRPQEYYFHCMAGREGLIDTAVKTARSGYLQRCLIKHLEGIKVHYDHTVRDSDNSVIQFQYGEDALDVTKQVYLNKYNFAVKNYDSMMRKYNPKALIGKVDEETADTHMKKALKKPYKYAPALSEFSPSVYLGSTSEKFAKALEEYAENNPDGLLVPQSSKKSKVTDAEIEILTKKLKQQGGAIAKPKQFKNLLKTVYARSLVEPGEAVGLLASQGVGEPSTQMTLNTFHFAGHGAANVTLGIPRLREIVMTASAQIRTPVMKLPVYEHITEDEMKVFCKNLNKLTLAECVDDVRVIESLSSKTPENGFSRRKTYNVHLKLYDPAEYSKEYNVEPIDISYAIRRFSAILDKEITIELRKVTREQTGSAANIGRGQKLREKPGENENNEDEDAPVRETQKGDDEVDEGDAESRKRSEKTKEITSYSDEGESDEEENKKDNEDHVGDSDNESDIQDDSERQRKHSKQLGEKLSQLEDKIVQTSHYMTKLECDREGGYVDFELEFSSKALKMLLVGIIEKACRKTVVREVRGISRAILLDKEKNKDGSTKKQRSIQTEGANLMGIRGFGQDFIDLNQLYCNDIDAIRRTYGVEAARASIINEVAGIFQVYGIGVDFRHLALLADYMTYDGGYKPFNRTGLSGSPSPLLRASFETTASIIAEAALYANDTIFDVEPRIEPGSELATQVNNFDIEILSEINNLDFIPTSTPAPLPIPTSPLKDRFNHASSDCAAVILQSTPNSSGASAILSEKKDRYMLTPCNTSKRWVITELCNEIRIDTIVLANYEFFSGAFKKFRVSVSRSWPVSEEGWLPVGEFRARNVRGVQTFQLPRPTPDFYRYLRIDFLDHYGNEYYCPLSLLRVYGVDQMEAFRLEEDVESTNKVNEETPAVFHDDFQDLHKFLESSQFQDDIYASPEEIEAFERTLYQEDSYSPADPAPVPPVQPVQPVQPAQPAQPAQPVKNGNETENGEFESTRASSPQYQQPQRTPSQVNAGESIYRTINKRLATLEAQSQMLSRALKDSRLAQRGLSGKVESLALRNEVRLAETIKVLDQSHKETQDERDRLKYAQASLTLLKVMVGKRLSIAQIVILLAVTGYIASHANAEKYITTSGMFTQSTKMFTYSKHTKDTKLDTLTKHQKLSFEYLPTEVQKNVLVDVDLMTLKMVSLVNKSLRNLVADVLFAYVSVDSNTSEMQPGQSYFRLTRGSVRHLHLAYPKTLVDSNVTKRCLPISQMTKLNSLHINLREMLYELELAAAEEVREKELAYWKHNLIDYIPQSNSVKELTLVVNSLNDFHFHKFSIQQLISKFAHPLTLVIVKDIESEIDRYVLMDFTQPFQFAKVILCELRSSVVFLKTAFEEVGGSGVLFEVSFMRGLEILRKTYYSTAFVVNE
ncbi:hypothetical protein E3P77_00623 [Wallemia ichthyophaga]|nr:hypothetical protein E3P77_00623 [Wallemia ichthyophaga]